MNCDIAREAISAGLDGEPSGVKPAELDSHLDTCPDCVSWRDSAYTVTRRARIALAPTAPAAPAALVAALRDSPGRTWRASQLTKARLGLVAVAVLQLVITVPPLILGSDRYAPIHIAHEMGAFDMALAIGFLAAAWRPAHARGMHVLVGAAALLLIGTAVVDVATARTTPAAEVPHLLAVAGWILLRLVAQLPARDTEQAATPIELLRRRRGAAAREPTPVGALRSGLRGDVAAAKRAVGQ
jgi:predicted anti-sigma-YlaC factor YlaD